MPVPSEWVFGVRALFNWSAAVSWRLVVLLGSLLLHVTGASYSRSTGGAQCQFHAPTSPRVAQLSCLTTAFDSVAVP